MKIFNIKHYALIVCLFMGSSAFGYTFGFSNHTKKTLVIGLGLVTAGPWDFNIVKPGKRVEFSYPAGTQFGAYCLGGVGAMEHKPVFMPGITMNGGLDMYDPEGMMLPGVLMPKITMYEPKATVLPRRFRDTVFPVLLKNAGISNMKVYDFVFLPDEVYQETVKNAANIGSGFDEFLCNAVILSRALNKGECPTILSDIITWIGGFISKSACRDREIAIIEDPKTNELIFTTPLN